MDYQSAIEAAKDFARGAMDAVRANDVTTGGSCPNCGQHPGSKVKCQCCGEELS